MKVMDKRQDPSRRPPVTGTMHVLPFEKLSPDDFERLCVWLIRREGYEAIEFIGPSGNEHGRDILASRSGSHVAFQCKRVKNFEPQDALAEISKIKSLPAQEQPSELIFFSHVQRIGSN